MTRNKLFTFAVLPLLFAGAWGASTLMRDDHGPRDATVLASPATARISLPGLAGAAESEPGLPSLARMSPRPGAATQAPGPFDDRFVVTKLRFDGRAVHGTVRITCDVSDILELQAVAGFYDVRGALIGTGRYIYHVDEAHEHATATGNPSEVEPFSIEVPADIAGKAAAASVGVPVLVNE